MVTFLLRMSLYLLPFLISPITGHRFELSAVDELKPCPGLYCGRSQLENASFSSCGSCPRGYRRNDSSLCVPCDSTPSTYDWLYLGFMVILSLVLHWFSIDLGAKRRHLDWKVMSVHCCVILEGLVAAIFTLLLIQPIGSLGVHACSVTALSDWYTLMHNPSPDYGSTLYCTQEAVYPLYTMVFLYYFWSLLSMFLIRPWVSRKVLPEVCRGAMYSAMYFIPVLALVQAVLAGLLYYSFPYLVIIFSVISTATHFACRLDQTTKKLVVATATNARNLVILLGHWLLLGYGLIALVNSRSMASYYYYCIIPLLPCPALFYVLTVRYTDPEKHHTD